MYEGNWSTALLPDASLRPAQRYCQPEDSSSSAFHSTGSVGRVLLEPSYLSAARTGNPVFCIVDDTIASKTKPLSRALHPIEDAYFHQSHLKKKQDYGHQAVAVMLSCNGIVLNYAFVMYNKSISKIDIVQSEKYRYLFQCAKESDDFDSFIVVK